MADFSMTSAGRLSPQLETRHENPIHPLSLRTHSAYQTAQRSSAKKVGLSTITNME